jgi:phosphogluconate dehydratase
MALHSKVSDITARIAERSRPSRDAYLAQLRAASTREPGLDRMGCANVAHAFAGMPLDDRFKVVTERKPNIGIVTAYNDMLSAHTPLQAYPAFIKDEARKLGATAQVAGGVPAMCDGVTQGTSGMELSLFSRDVIAMATAVALSHDMFDAALMLGVCDKIVPGLLIGALQFGHLPMVFVPAGPMPSGIPNKEKAQGARAGRAGPGRPRALLESEFKSYHSPGTCTFYGTANSNQMLLEAMGLHVPGTAFVNPGGALREELTREAARTVLGITKAKRFAPDRPDRRRTRHRQRHGGAAGHRRLHQPPDPLGGGGAFGRHRDRLERFLRPLRRGADAGPCLPQRQRRREPVPGRGRPGFIIRELLDAGFMHEDVLTVREGGIREYTREPALAGEALAWHEVGLSKDEAIVRPPPSPSVPPAASSCCRATWAAA